MRLLSVSLALALSAVIAACSGKASSTAPTTPGNKVEAPAVSAADDELAFVPVEVDLVVGVDLAGMRRSALWDRYQGKVAEALGPKLGEVNRTCGVDAMTAIDRVLVGGNYTNNTFSGVIVVRGPLGGKLIDCATRLDKSGEVRVDRGTLSITENQKVIVLARVVGNALVIQTGAEVAPAALEATIAAGAPLRGSPAFMKLYDRREAGASGWLMISGKSEMATSLASLGIKPRSIDGTLTVTDTMRGALRLTLGSEDEANQFATMVNGQLGAVPKGVYESASARAIGPIAQFDVLVTDAQLQTIAAMLGVGP